MYAILAFLSQNGIHFRPILSQAPGMDCAQFAILSLAERPLRLGFICSCKKGPLRKLKGPLRLEMADGPLRILPVTSSPTLMGSAVGIQIQWRRVHSMGAHEGLSGPSRSGSSIEHVIGSTGHKYSIDHRFKT